MYFNPTLFHSEFEVAIQSNKWWIVFKEAQVEKGHPLSISHDLVQKNAIPAQSSPQRIHSLYAIGYILSEDSQ